MLPLSDAHPTRTTPVLTWALITACIIVYLLQLSAGDGSTLAQQQVIFHFGFIPALTVGPFFNEIIRAPAELVSSLQQNPGWPAVLSSMFMHGGWMHLCGNMLYLYIFGDNLEDRLGRLRFIGFYLVCGLAAALAQALTDPASTIPMVGASGAISGILGGYLVLYPRQQVTVMAPYVGLTQMPAVVVLGMWFLAQLTQSFNISAGSGGVAFWAHIGGFICGAALIRLLAPNAELIETAPILRVTHRQPGQPGKLPRLWK